MNQDVGHEVHTSHYQRAKFSLDEVHTSFDATKKAAASDLKWLASAGIAQNRRASILISCVKRQASATGLQRGSRQVLLPKRGLTGPSGAM